MQRRIGLTGGIATGKTTVSDYLAEHHGLPVLDADTFAREAVAAGSPILAAIAQRHGRQILDQSGNLDRAQLGEIVFRDASERQWLEAQIHPYVRDRFDHHLRQLPDPVAVILSIPLLFEANLTHLVTEIWVVTCTAEQQLARLMSRNSLNEQQAQDRIAAQMPLAEKCAAADVVLDNSGARTDKSARALSQLYAQIERAIAIVT